MTRTSFGANMLVKPAALQERGSVELSFDGYNRNGNQVSNYLLSDRYLLGSDVAANQWRGYSRAIDEQDRNLAFNLTFNPEDSWLINYEFSVDKFQNNAPSVTMNNVAQWFAPLDDVQFNNTVNLNTPLNFVPDSTQITNGLRLTKRFDDSAVLGAGISMSRLQQDSFGPEQALGYTQGLISTDNAYLNGKFNVSPSVSLEAFMRYNKRANDSSFPVVGFYEVTSTLEGGPGIIEPRIDSVTTKTYGLEAKLYPSVLKSNWSAGWTHVDKDRDLTYGENLTLPAPMMLYGEDSSSDEVFIRLASRPDKGWMIRVTPSYLWASQTGLVSEPEERWKLRSLVTYTKPEQNELSISGYYNITDTKNGLLGYSDYIVPTGSGSPGSAATTGGFWAVSGAKNGELVPVCRSEYQSGAGGNPESQYWRRVGSNQLQLLLLHHRPPALWLLAYPE